MKFLILFVLANYLYISFFFKIFASTISLVIYKIQLISKKTIVNIFDKYTL